MRLPLLVATLAVLAAPAHAQTAPPVSRDQAMTLPPDQLADIVLRQLGARVTSVTRPQFNADTGMQMASALQHLEFATAPHATDVVGLCAANLFQVEFEPPINAEMNRAATPVRARSVRAVEVFKVVGEIEPYAEVSQSRAEEENRRCEGAGPVIPADYNDHARAPFFEYSGGIDRVTALLVLQRAIGEARDGTYRNIGCACSNPAQVLGSLDLANVTALDAGPVSVTDRTRYRIGASVLISGTSSAREYWRVAIEVVLSERSGLVDSIRGLGRTNIDRSITTDN